MGPAAMGCPPTSAAGGRLRPGIALLLLGLASCATTQELGALVQPVAAVRDEAPPGRALVVFHRPIRRAGARNPATVWNGPVFVGELKSGHGCSCVCEPGRHYFVSRSEGWVGVVEADLLPGRVYDVILELKTGWATMDAHVTPVREGDRRRRKIPDLLASLTYCEPKPVDYVRDFETAQRAEVDRIIRDFTTGAKRVRLERLEPDDHR